MARGALAAVVALAACSQRGTVTFVDAGPRALSLDIVVGDDGVGVYTNGTDLATSCSDAIAFPAPGGHVEYSDVGCDQASCLASATIERSGATVETATIVPGQPIGFGSNVTTIDEAVLVLTGCDGSARVPIGGHVAPVPTFSAMPDAVASTIAITWSATPAARTALVELDGVSAIVEHITTAAYTFTGDTGEPFGAYSTVRLRAFAALDEIATPFGTARVWTGDQTISTLRPWIDVPPTIRLLPHRKNSSQ